MHWREECRDFGLTSDSSDSSSANELPGALSFLYVDGIGVPCGVCWIFFLPCVFSTAERWSPEAITEAARRPLVALDSPLDIPPSLSTLSAEEAGVEESVSLKQERKKKQSRSAWLPQNHTICETDIHTAGSEWWHVSLVSAVVTTCACGENLMPKMARHRGIRQRP